MKKLLSLLIATALVLTNSFNMAFADEIEDTETTTTLDSSIFENVDYSFLGEECNESNIETDYNLYDELDYHECESVYDWIYETYNVSHSDEEANQFIWNNINKFVLLAIENEIVIYPKMSTFWFGDTHEGIYEKSVDALAKYSNTIYDFYRNSGCYNNLRIYTAEPDTTEKVSRTHYYVYTGTPSAFGSYYKNRDSALLGDNSTYSISARTRFEEHYFSAVNLYKNGYRTEGLKELGYALHYLQDIGCPPHAAGDDSNGEGKNDPHWEYENYVNSDYLPNVYNESSYCYNSTIVNDVYYGYVSTNLNELARIAKEEYDDYKYVMTNTSFKTAANITMRKTQEYTTAYLIKFYNEVHSNSTPYIQDDCYYALYNEGNNKYLSLNNNNFSWSSTKNEKCKFYIDIIDGHYVIKSGNNYFYLNSNDNLALSTSHTLQAYYKFIPTEYGTYKIFANDHNKTNTSKDKFDNTLNYALLGPKLKDFYPDDTSNQWVIEKY